MGDSVAEGLREPLLLPPQDEEAGAGLQPHTHVGAAAEDVEELPAAAGMSSVPTSAANCTNAILGAGMFALPRAFAGLGLLAGSALTLAVALLMLAGVDMLLRAAEQRGQRAWSLSGLLEQAWGRGAALAVRCAIIAMGLGFLIIYLVVCVEMLLGTEEISGLIPDLFPSLQHPHPPWWLHRTAVLCWVTLGVVPMMLSTSLSETVLVSVASVSCSTASCLVLVGLCIVAGVQGQLPDVPWLPDPSVFSSEKLAAAVGMLGTVGVLMTAFIIQHQVPPVVAELKDYTVGRARAVFACALLIAAAIYVATGACGAALFGREVAGDVLASMDVSRVATLLGSHAAAMAVVVGVKGAVVGALMTSFPITLWPMRAELIDLLLRALGSSGQVTRRAFYLITFSLLATVLLLAVVMRSVYQLVGLVGSVSGILLAFIFPGLLAVKDPSSWRRALGWVLLPAGTLLMTAGLMQAALAGQG